MLVALPSQRNTLSQRRVGARIAECYSQGPHHQQGTGSRCQPCPVGVRGRVVRASQSQGRSEPPAPFHGIPADEPEQSQRPREPQRHLWIAFKPPAERGMQIVMFTLQLIQPWQHVWTEEV